MSTDDTTPARKEWVKAAYSPNGTMVTVSLQQGNASAKATVKAYTSSIKKGVTEARGIAERMLNDLLEAIQ